MSNKMYARGNLTRDPELRTLPNSNTSVVKLSIASSEKFKGKDGKDREEVAFLDCEAWDSAAENIANNFKKGDPIMVSARARTESWTDAEGKKRSTLRFRVETFGKVLANGSKTNNSSDESDVDGEDMPF